MGQIDTEEYIKGHITRVRNHLLTFTQLLQKRAALHDMSKLQEPELTWWKQMDEEPRYPYGSPEYNDKVRRWKKVFDHHYKYNRHHPEHYESGFLEMTLVDLVEMLCDWLGYKDRISISDAMKVCEQQMERYGFSDDVRQIMSNTLIRYFSLLGGKNPNFADDSVVNTPDGILEELQPATAEDKIGPEKHLPPGSIVDILA